jgi:hypothetical protein
MTESPTPPADPNSTPEDPDTAPAPNPGEDPDPINPAPGPDSGQGDPVDPVQNGAPATGPEAPQPPTS